VINNHEVSFKAKSEEIMLKWREGKCFEAWYEQNGLEPFKRLVQEMPSDDQLQDLLMKKIEGIKFEDEKIAKVYNQEWWIYQIAGMRALREEAMRICNLHYLGG
jgi:hypothetical protein